MGVQTSAHSPVLSPIDSTGTPARWSIVTSRFDKRCAVGIAQMPAAAQPAAPAADDRQRQREVVVRMTVAHVAAVQDQRAIEYRAVAVGQVRELPHERREHARVIALDPNELFDLCRIVLVMRQQMERIRHARWSYVIWLVSAAIMNDATRVMSAWNASAIMSNIRCRRSANAFDISPGDSTLDDIRASAVSTRRSTSRTASR